jgi:hypothetical protein
MRSKPIISKPPRPSFDKNQKLRDEARRSGEYHQTAGAIAERMNVMREQMKGSDPCFRCAPQVRS